MSLQLCILTSFVLIIGIVRPDVKIEKLLGSDDDEAKTANDTCLRDVAVFRITCRDADVSKQLECKCCAAKFVYKKIWNGPSDFCVKNADKLKMDRCQKDFKDHLKDIPLKNAEKDICNDPDEYMRYVAKFFKGKDINVTEIENIAHSYSNSTFED